MAPTSAEFELIRALKGTGTCWGCGDAWNIKSSYCRVLRGEGVLMSEVALYMGCTVHGGNVGFDPQ